MKGKAVVTGLCGLLFFASPAFADSLLTSAEKAYRLLQTISSQLQEAQEALGPRSPAPATTALAMAEEQVRIAFAHCCHALYTAHLEVAKAALARRDNDRALSSLLKADEALAKCPEAAPTVEPKNNRGPAVRESALAKR